jgi:hypothetical protein
MVPRAARHSKLIHQDQRAYSIGVKGYNYRDYGGLISLADSTCRLQITIHRENCNMPKRSTARHRHSMLKTEGRCVSPNKFLTAGTSHPNLRRVPWYASKWLNKCHDHQRLEASCRTFPMCALRRGFLTLIRVIDSCNYRHVCLGWVLDVGFFMNAWWWRINSAENAHFNTRHQYSDIIELTVVNIHR